MNGEKGGKGLVRLLLGNVQLRNPESAWYHENGSMMQRSKAYPGNKDECLNPDFDDQGLPFAYPLVDLLIISVPSSASACSGKERIVEWQSVFSKLKFKFPELVHE
ncbi:hypothetical protein NC652_024228 [Populus alba x Populus x berolinensis]|nr:hypothetical protein NC652_024228 [Populus alba x Populus x berolinensis]